MCGIAGMLTFKQKNRSSQPADIKGLVESVKRIKAKGYNNCLKNDWSLDDQYLCGEQIITSLLKAARRLKCDVPFLEIFFNSTLQASINHLADDLKRLVQKEEQLLAEHMGHLTSNAVSTMSGRIETLKDTAWCLSREILDNIDKIKTLCGLSQTTGTPATLTIFKQINTVLNSIDRLEVRGRDSAGLSLMFVFDKTQFESFNDALNQQNLIDQFTARTRQEVLINHGISLRESKDAAGQAIFSISLTYKIATEIGRLGDNIAFLRNQTRKDKILQTLTGIAHRNFTISCHTRWASVGAITEANCHPVDNKISPNGTPPAGIIHASLNGDIDNYLTLKKAYEKEGHVIPEAISTDTKMIPLQIEKHIRQGADVQEAFRLAVNDFEGSHAICMHTDLAPGKIFLAQRGSGQALFIGLSDDHYMPSSEIYGLVEETPCFIKLDGEKTANGSNAKPRGQMVILNQDSAGGLDGIQSLLYDGTPMPLGPEDIKTTRITSRDIDRQNFPHYFLKEISESPSSVEKTLQNRWKIRGEEQKRHQITLDESIVPESIKEALRAPFDSPRKIRSIFFVGQGTAGVAALACADIVSYYLNDPLLKIGALKASELSGFKLGENGSSAGMQDTLIIAISQSGTTTDTNRTVDMVREIGAHTIAIVNRRDSDITFKVDGVFYTSGGRDIEMSVASTKAFYSQIVAGAIIGLYLADLLGRRNQKFIAHEIQQLIQLPDCMRKIIAKKKQIEKSAKQLAVSKTHWAAVGSGPNKASADEIRIKLSELCYKTISSDFVEDKKHIDLSAEPLIIVCAAGTKGTVIGDIVKDTAIFHAHKATPIVIADEGEERFNPYAADVFHVPPVAQHLAPIVNTLAGHLWGYYAALSINEGSHFFYRFRQDIQKITDKYLHKGLDIFEIILEKTFREKIVSFYNEFRQKKAAHRFSATLGVEASSDLTLLSKYLAGKLPASDFVVDFGIKGTAGNMLNTLFDCLGQTINQMARPIDAIKHQAKTVTVGTSRIVEKIEGILFEALAANNFNISQVINRNIIVLKNLQAIVAEIDGMTLYHVEGLNLLGEPTDESSITITKKEGSSKNIRSRVETDNRLQGTKKIIVQQGNAYVGKGVIDGRSILIIPIISASPETPNLIEHLLLLNIAFHGKIALPVKIKALGGKFEHIKDIVQENSIKWDNKYLERIEIEELFGRSAEKIGDFIVSSLT